jgi:membrane protease YdiL (CAAX protease family)
MFVSLSFVIAGGMVLDQENPDHLKVLNALQQIFLFILPAVLASILYSGNTKQYMSITGRNFSLFFLASVIMLFAIPLINYTGLINSKLDLPERFSELEQTIRSMEDDAEQMTLKLLNVNTFSGYLINILVIAILPAIGEEFLFRGVIQNLFKEWTKNIHIAIILSAFLFSFIHFQFYGFLPRFLLGLLFGYLLVWSGSIWLPVTAHFINNAFAVSFYYFGKSEEVIHDAESFGAEPSTYIYLLFSLLFLSLLLYFFYKTGKKQNAIGSLPKP